MTAGSAVKRQLAIFLQGLVVVVPTILTIWAVWGSVTWLDSTIQWVFEGTQLQPKIGEKDVLKYPMMGTFFALACIWVIGLLMRLYLFATFVSFAEEVLSRVPLVKTLYGSVRDLLDFFHKGTGGHPTGRAVEVDLGGDAHMIGITTTAPTDEGHVGVYLPLSYMIGGFLVYMPRDRVAHADMDVETALKLVLTGGMGTDTKSEVE